MKYTLSRWKIERILAPITITADYIFLIWFWLNGFETIFWVFFILTIVGIFARAKRLSDIENEM